LGSQSILTLISGSENFVKILNILFRLFLKVIFWTLNQTFCGLVVGFGFKLKMSIFETLHFPVFGDQNFELLNTNYFSIVTF